MAGKRGRPKNKKEDTKDPEYMNKKLGNISVLQDEINSMLDEIDTLPQDLIPPKDLLPGLDFEYTKYDYERDIETIKEDAKETLECIAGLYLKESEMKKKNIKSIIKLDAENISEIKFSLSCAKRALVNCMKQIDAGANDPNMHMAVSSHLKEIRESSSKTSDLLSKMKSFYKEIRDEYERKEIIEQQKLEEEKAPQPEEIENKQNDLVLFDQRKWNKLIEEYRKDPTLLNGKTFGTAGD